MSLSDFRRKVDQFLTETGMAERDLGFRSVRDASFVSDLRAGREPRERTRERVLAFMAEVQGQRHGEAGRERVQSMPACE